MSQSNTYPAKDGWTQVGKPKESKSKRTLAALAEPEESDGKAAEFDVVTYLRTKLVNLRTKASQLGSHIVNTKGVVKVATEFEILVFGPARVGKSTMVGELTGTADIATSSSLDSVTAETECFEDKYHVRWWDTPGFEEWSVEVAADFLKHKFYERGILPKAALFCRTANSLGKGKVVEYMFKEMQKHGILTVFVITKLPFIPDSELVSILDEATLLLGGSEKTNKFMYEGTAIEVLPKKAYIVGVNSKVDTMFGKVVPKMNMNTLRRILIQKLDSTAQSKLVELYKDNLGFWSKLGYGLLEVGDVLGLQTSDLALTSEEREVYQKLQGGNAIGIDPAVIKRVMDKVLGVK